MEGCRLRWFAKANIAREDSVGAGERVDCWGRCCRGYIAVERGIGVVGCMESGPGVCCKGS